MQPFKELKILLINVGVCGMPDLTPSFTKFRHRLVGMYLAACFWVGAVLTLIVSCTTNDLRTLLLAIHQTIGLTANGGAMVMSLPQSGLLKEIFRKLEENYEQCNETFARLVAEVRFAQFFFVCSQRRRSRFQKCRVGRSVEWKSFEIYSKDYPSGDFHYIFRKICIELGGLLVQEWFHQYERFISTNCIVVSSSK